MYPIDISMMPADAVSTFKKKIDGASTRRNIRIEAYSRKEPSLFNASSLL
jgi:hypothetical protein